MSTGDPIRDLLASIIEALVVQPLIRYRTTYACTITHQWSDGTVDLQPDDTTMPTVTQVPIRGLPGVTVTVQTGARALLSFEGGNATSPICTLFQTDSLDTITIKGIGRCVVDFPEIDLGPNASRGVAREGDFGTFTGISPTAGAVTGTFQIATGSTRVKAQ